MAICNNSKHFFEANKLSADVLIFHPKREAIAHGRMATDPVFPLWAPNCHLEGWQFGSFFAEIPRSPTIKVPIYRRFRGVGREKIAPQRLPHPPPPYAPEAIASLYQAEYVKGFYLCRHGACVAAADAHPRSWRTMRHDMASTFTDGGCACRVARCRPPLRNGGGRSAAGARRQGARPAWRARTTLSGPGSDCVAV